jgi:hypothetical protein
MEPPRSKDIAHGSFLENAAKGCHLYRGTPNENDRMELSRPAHWRSQGRMRRWIRFETYRRTSAGAADTSTWSRGHGRALPCSVTPWHCAFSRDRMLLAAGCELIIGSPQGMMSLI